MSRWSLLRLALISDAIASGTMGALLTAAADPLAEWFGLPRLLLLGVGLALIPYAALLVLLALRSSTTRLPAQLVVAGNVLWVVASLLLLVLDLVAPTALGTAFVVAQALIVAILAEAQFVGLRRERIAAA